MSNTEMLEYLCICQYLQLRPYMDRSDDLYQALIRRREELEKLLIDNTYVIVPAQK